VRAADLGPVAAAAAVDAEGCGGGPHGGVGDGEERGGAVWGEEGHLALCGGEVGVGQGGRLWRVVGGVGGVVVGVVIVGVDVVLLLLVVVVWWVGLGLGLGWVRLMGVVGAHVGPWRWWRRESGVLMPGHGVVGRWDAGDRLSNVVLRVGGWWHRRGRLGHVATGYPAVCVCYVGEIKSWDDGWAGHVNICILACGLHQVPLT
jgi:hypothetical protein